MPVGGARVEGAELGLLACSLPAAREWVREGGREGFWRSRGERRHRRRIRGVTYLPHGGYV